MNMYKEDIGVYNFVIFAIRNNAIIYTFINDYIIIIYYQYLL